MLDGLKKFGRALKRDYLPAPPKGGEALTLGRRINMHLQKLSRIIQRDYLPQKDPTYTGYRYVDWPMSKQWLFYGGISLAAAVASLFFPYAALGVLVAPAAIAYDVKCLRKYMLSRQEGKITPGVPNADVIHLNGQGRGISTLENTQQLIEKMTKGHEGAADLPPALKAKLGPYLADSEEAAAQIGANATGRDLDEIPFLRGSFNARNRPASAVMATVLTAQGVEKKRLAALQEAIEEQFTRGVARMSIMKPLRFKSGANP